MSSNLQDPRGLKFGERNMIRKLIPEVFEEVSKERAQKGKIEILRQNDTTSLREVLRHNFDENIKFTLPEGAPPFTRQDVPVGYQTATLGPEIRRLYLFVEGGHDTLAQNKREMLFVQFLEAIHESEADVIVWMKDGELEKHYNGFTYAIVQEAFPNLLPYKEVRGRGRPPKAEKVDENS